MPVLLAQPPESPIENASPKPSDTRPFRQAECLDLEVGRPWYDKRRGYCNSLPEGIPE
jgi:hypothetical protein